MTHANITNHTEMKNQVLKYVNVDTEQMRKTFPEYVLAAHSYEEFKDAILDQYPDATGYYAGFIRLSPAILSDHAMAHQ